MLIMSHKSWSYLPVRQWWIRPFSFLTKTQEVDIRTQYLRYNVKVFDLYIRFNKENKLVLSNGCFEYKYDLDDLLNDLSWIDSRTDCYIQVVHDEKGHTQQFKDFCNLLEDSFTHIKFFGGYSAENEEYTFSYSPRIRTNYSLSKTKAKNNNELLKMTYKDSKIILPLAFVNYG